MVLADRDYMRVLSRYLKSVGKWKGIGPLSLLADSPPALPSLRLSQSNESAVGPVWHRHRTLRAGVCPNSSRCVKLDGHWPCRRNSRWQ